MSEGLRVEWVPARLSVGRDTGISFLGEGEQHSVSCSQVGGCEAQGGRGGELVPGVSGGRDHCSPAGTAGVPKPPDFCSPASSSWHFRTQLLPLPLLCRWAPASPDSPEHGSFSHTRVGGSPPNPLFGPSTSGYGACTQLCDPSPLLEKLIYGLAPAPKSVKFSQKRLLGRSSRECPAWEPEALTFPEPSQHPTTRALPSTYSPGPC